MTVLLRWSLTKLIAVILASLLVVPVGVAQGAHKLKRERTGSFTFQATDRAGGATARTTVNVRETNAQSRIEGDIDVNGLQQRERVRAFLVDNEGPRNVNLGSLSVTERDLDRDRDRDRDEDFNDRGFDNFEDEGFDEDFDENGDEDFDREDRDGDDDEDRDNDDFGDDFDSDDFEDFDSRDDFDDDFDRDDIDRDNHDRDRDDEDFDDLDRDRVTADLRLDFSTTVDNLQDFDKIVITREPENDTDPNPSSEVLFEVNLPHQ